MKYEWFLARYKDGKFIDKSPWPLTRSDADILLSLARARDDGYTYKAVQRDDL